MTVNRLRQVLRVYTSQWIVWALAVLLLLLHLFAYAADSEPPTDRAWTLARILVLPGLISDLILGALVSAMLAVQFGNPHARLLPGFAAAHLTAAGGVIAVAIAIQAALVPGWLGIGGRLAVIALALGTVAAMLWGTLRRRPVGRWVFMGVLAIALLAFSRMEGLVAMFVDGPVYSIGLGIAAIVSLAVLAKRLMESAIDVPRYSRNMLLSFWDDSDEQKRLQTDSPEQAPIWQSSRDIQFRLVGANESSPGPWRRAFLRQTAGGHSIAQAAYILVWPVVIFACLTPAIMSSIAEFPLLVVMPICIVMGLPFEWNRRWSSLAAESLRPLDRAEFAREIARVLVFDLVPFAAVNCILIVVYSQLSPGEPQPSVVVTQLALTTAQYVIGGCFLFWLLSFRHFLMAFCVLGLLLIVFGFSPIIEGTARLADPGFWSSAKAIVAGVWAALVALCFYQMGLQRWYHVDLG